MPCVSSSSESSYFNFIFIIKFLPSEIYTKRQPLMIQMSVLALHFSGACNVYITTEFGPYFILTWYNTGCFVKLDRAGKVPQGRHRHCAEHITLLALKQWFQEWCSCCIQGTRDRAWGPNGLRNKVPGSHCRSITAERERTRMKVRSDAKRAKIWRNNCGSN